MTRIVTVWSHAGNLFSLMFDLPSLKKTRHHKPCRAAVSAFRSHTVSHTHVLAPFVHSPHTLSHSLSLSLSLSLYQATTTTSAGLIQISSFITQHTHSRFVCMPLIDL